MSSTASHGCWATFILIEEDPNNGGLVTCTVASGARAEPRERSAFAYPANYRLTLSRLQL